MAEVSRRRVRIRAPSRFAIAGALMAIASGCASRVVEVESPPPAVTNTAASKAVPGSSYGQDGRQGAGLGSASADDPAKRIGPNGQPAPYGRDTVTGRPVSDLNNLTVPGAPQRTASATAASAGGQKVIVAKGDTLTTIARRHNVSLDALMKANGLASGKIQVGQSLTIPRG